MGGTVLDYAVVYDISDDKERRKVDKLLKGYGFRIQKSVFECRLIRRTREELIRRMEKLDIKTGFVKLYRLEYATKNQSIGGVIHQSPDAGNAFIV
jgi:CRISPR-associated protein Cas2